MLNDHKRPTICKTKRPEISQNEGEFLRLFQRVL
jgi:hypothetical protein